ncbi:MBL fold metallo-hydrolase [Mycolicibacterium obuense]|uniref:Metallo-beta-lactamase domain-containing protein n=1 Tax=Mycolicibacterium obuense TaxID=1807 RepID=A0A0M2JWA9_9MYCO|nr:MBL fold metallo-hydrolase [Mycolicibacterium obuense]KKF00874.1 hypothetical protein WN67_16570 [Mycolicibacterium obuense]
MNQLRVGSTTITSVVEQTIGALLTANLPQATPDALRELPWLWPHYMNDHDEMQGVIQSLVIEHAGTIVVVDTCVGDDKDIAVAPELAHARTGFLEHFSAAGFRPDAVDYVIATHMHVDHVGWNTHLTDGRWQPTFPNARYLFAAPELTHWTARAGQPTTHPDDTDLAEDDARRARDFRQTQIDVHRQSIQPILDAGLADVIDIPHTVVPGLVLVPAAGHTPGHVMVEITADGGRAVITGDSFHHPSQIAHPEWDDLADTDLRAGAAARHQILADIANTSTRLIGSHFSHPSFGTVTTDGGSYRFDAGGTP